MCERDDREGGEAYVLFHARTRRGGERERERDRESERERRARRANKREEQLCVYSVVFISHVGNNIAYVLMNNVATVRTCFRKFDAHMARDRIWGSPAPR